MILINLKKHNRDIMAISLKNKTQSYKLINKKLIKIWKIKKLKVDELTEIKCKTIFLKMYKQEYL